MLTVAAAAVLAAGCGSSAASQTNKPAVEKPDITVAVVPAISAAGLYIAVQRGYFAAVGLHVKVVPIASGINALPNLVNGSVDIDEGQWAADLAAEASGAARLKALAAASSGGPGVQQIVVPAGSPVQTVPGLRGKTIAVNALKGLAVLLTSNVLESNGVDPASVHFVVIPFPAMGTALAAHRVDAAFIAEPSLSAAETGHGVVPLADVDQGASQNFPISGYVATTVWAQKYPKTAAAFVWALERGQTLAGTSRAAVQQALVPALHISKVTAAMMALGTFPLTVNPIQLARVADLMQHNGLLPSSVKPAALVQELVNGTSR
jgi:NitT/TauT family transport system substrate-binding protein